MAVLSGFGIKLQYDFRKQDQWENIDINDINRKFLESQLTENENDENSLKSKLLGKKDQKSTEKI